MSVPPGTYVVTCDMLPNVITMGKCHQMYKETRLQMVPVLYKLDSLSDQIKVSKFI